MASQSSHSLSQQASTNYKEAFSLFDKRGTGRVALESLGDLLRACGQNPTLSEIRDLEKGIGGDCEPGPCLMPKLLLLTRGLPN
jgi:Ca2+-binding EF-hand superfamily protein